MISRRKYCKSLGLVTRAANQAHRDRVPSLFEQLESRTLMSTVAHPVGISSLVAPSDLAAIVNSPTNVALNWTDNDTNAAGYFVLRSTDGIKYATIAKLTGASMAAYTDKLAPSFKHLSYEVEAFSGTVLSAPTSAAAAVTAMAPPISLVAKATSPTAITLTWLGKEPGALGYNILRSTDGVNFTQIAHLTSVKTIAYIDKSASSDSAYAYEVQAYSGSDTSDASNIATVTTPLIAASGLAGSATSGTSIQIHWTGNDSAAKGYSILRSSDAKTFTQIASIDSDSTAYTDSSVISGHWYYYKIEATDGSVKSAATAAIAVSTPLTTPSSLSTHVNNWSNVSLSWTDNDSHASGYLVLRSLDGITYTTIAKLTGSLVASYADTAAPSFKQLSYQIKAFTGTIVSAACDAKDATTPMAPPIGVTAKATGPATVSIVWLSREPGATGFSILRSSDGTTYTEVGRTNSIKATTFIDSTVSSDSTYSYEVKAINGENSSTTYLNSTVTTPLIAPSGLAGSALSGTSIKISWTGNDDNAASYRVLRSLDGKTFSLLGTTAADNLEYTDNTVISGRTYIYAIQACDGVNASATSVVAKINTPLAAPSGLLTTINSPTSVTLNWTNNDIHAAGYVVLRSLDGTTFSTLAKITGAAVHTFIDKVALSGRVLTYKIQAFAGTILSDATAAQTATTPLLAPTTLTLTTIGGWANLNWANKDALTTGYQVLRSTDGISYSQIAQIDSVATRSYVDNTVSIGQTYSYQVRAFNAVSSSANSTAATIAIPQGDPSGVSIITRYGNELVITASGKSDSISISQNDDVLTIVADGETYTDTVPDAGVFIYTRGGSDTISIDSSVFAHTTIATIDSTTTFIDSESTHVSAWIDSTDTYTGTGVLHRIASFAGGVTKALGASLKNPLDAGTTTKVISSLWGTGPVMNDVNQGAVGDCYFMSSLAAFSSFKTSQLQESAVDLGDGTYAVRFISSGNPVYVRVSNYLSVGGFGGYKFAHPGANGSIWAAVMEKAFAYFRTGSNTYASINSGWMGSVYTNLGVTSNVVWTQSYNESSFYDLTSAAVSANEPVTFGTVSSPPNLVGGHAYTLVSLSKDGNGVTHYVLRNPWGVAGDAMEDSHGYVTLTFAQLQANCIDGAFGTS